MRDVAVVLLVFGSLLLLGALSPLGAEGLKDTEVAWAYRLAWDVSNALEDWSVPLVDGVGQLPDESAWGQVFLRVERIIKLLCREHSARGGHCLYPGY